MLLIMLVQRDQFFTGNPEMTEEPLRVTGIFAGNNIGGLDRFDRPKSNVT